MNAIRNFAVFFVLSTALASPSFAAVLYSADDDVLKRMSVEEARKTLRTVLPTKALVFAKDGWAPVVSMTIGPSRIEFKINEPPLKATLRLSMVATVEIEKAIADYVVVHPWVAGRSGVPGTSVAFPPKTVDLETAKRVADALYVLKHAVQRELRLAANVMDDPKFAEAVRAYRADTAKPELPEEVRRLRVQAESALRDKDFDGSEKLYEQALVVAPWWPEGHFNRALVLGELAEFGYAIVSMKRYLQLVPGAQNARAAQDKIYEWEGKTNK